MTPVFQEFEHNPSRGVYGDCHRACVASLLDKPLHEVPHFMDGLSVSCRDSEEFERREREYLLSQGLVGIKHGYMGEDNKLENVLNCQASLNPATYYILAGQSSTGLPHSVICLDAAMVHDPAGVKTRGIVAPLSDGYYLVTYLGSARLLSAATPPLTDPSQ